MTFYTDKVIYLFGGSSGIGLATACELAKQGAQIHIFARREAVLQQAQEKIQSYADTPPRTAVGRATQEQLPSLKTAAYSCVDITDDDNCSSVVAGAIQSSGKPDIVINCAGAARPNYFENISAQQFSNTLTLNVLGVRNIAAAVLPALKETQGHLINTSSIAGFIGVFGYTDYCASKFAIVGFSEALQQEVKQHGVSISVLYPPDTYTEGFEEEEKTKPPETRAISGGNKPITAKQVAESVVKALPKRGFTILPGLDNQLSLLLKRCCPWLVSWVMDRAIRKAQREL